MGKMHDLTLSEYPVIHQRFPAFLPACFDFHSSVPFSFAPRVRSLNWRSWGLRKMVRFKESPRFVKVLLVNNLEAVSFSGPKCYYLCFFSSLLLLLFGLRKSVCWLHWKRSLYDRKDNVMEIKYMEMYL